MVGMRDIFEELGADVKWNAASQQITATRGAKIIVLWIGRPYAMVDSTTLPLDVPPQLINGSTYVPVRFPSEALGAGVTWMSATRTVMINTASMPAIGGTTPVVTTPTTPVTPVEPVTPAITEAKGSLRGISLNTTPPTLIIEPYDGSAMAPYVIVPTAIFQRGATGAPVLRVVNLEDLQLGDDVTLHLDDASALQRGEARYTELKITYEAAAANSLLGNDGTVHRLGSDVAITREGVGETTIGALGKGEELTLRANPETDLIWAISAPAGAAQPPAPIAGTQILLLGPEGYTKPLKRGEVLTVRMEGTPNGQATFSIGDVHTGLPLVEGEDGIYSGQYKVARDELLVDAPIRASLTAAGEAAPLAESADHVSFDAVAPTAVDHFPAPDATVNTNRPAVQVTVTDGAGVGVDPASLSFHISGTDVTQNCVVTAERVTYYAPALQPGQYRSILRGADLAGNAFDVRWNWTVAPVGQQTAITSVSHEPAATILGKGDTLTVTLRAQPGGKSAFFQVAGHADVVAMQLQPGGDGSTWAGAYRVKYGDTVADAAITGHFTDAADQTHQSADPQLLTVDADMQTRLTVTAPVNGGTVAKTFTISGTGIPQRKVSYTVDYEGRSRLLNAPTAGQVAQGQATVAADGTWSVDIDTRPVANNPLLKKITQFTIELTLLGRGGTEVASETLTVKPQ